MAHQDHITDLIPGYALDCLDPEEAHIVTAHLADCSECREELRAYQAIVDDLPLAIPQFDPPASLKNKILAQTSQRIPAAKGSSGPFSRLSGPIQHILAVLSRSPGFALASLALVIVLAAGNIILANQIVRQNQAQREGMRTLALAGTDRAPGAHGLIVISTDGKDGTLVVDGLTELSSDLEYQLWLIRDGERDSGGTFTVGNDGYGGLWVYSRQPLGSYQAFGITIEPVGGSPGPTGPKVLGGEF
jgi:anti-sigma-K factor RskA